MPNEQRFFLRAESGAITEVTRDILIGRSEVCDLVIDHGHPSRQHARISIEDGQLYLEDLHSANGTFINKVRLHEKQMLADGDTLAFGLYKMDFYIEGSNTNEIAGYPLIDPNQTVVFMPDQENTTEAKKRFSLLGDGDNEIINFDKKITIGRDPTGTKQLDLTIDNKGVSSLHATLEPSAEGLIVTDLESANGTYVNDTPVTENLLATNKDRLRFHEVEVIVWDRNPQATPSISVQEKINKNNGDPVSAENPYIDLGDIAQKGGTVVMPISPAVPPAWLEETGAGTMVVSPAELKKVNAIQYEQDTAQLESSVDAPTLLVLSGDDAGRPYKLELAGALNYWNIGRDSSKHDLSIVLNDPSVSDFHAKLVCRESRWQVIDQMSTNSVFVNGNRHSSAYLASRDRIRIGGIETMLLLPRPPAGQTGVKPPSWYSKIFRWLGIQH